MKTDDVVLVVVHFVDAVKSVVSGTGSNVTNQQSNLMDEEMYFEMTDEYLSFVLMMGEKGFKMRRCDVVFVEIEVVWKGMEAWKFRPQRLEARV